jgi:hypothetical protein
LAALAGHAGAAVGEVEVGDVERQYVVRLAVVKSPASR